MDARGRKSARRRIINFYGFSGVNPGSLPLFLAPALSPPFDTHHGAGMTEIDVMATRSGEKYPVPQIIDYILSPLNGDMSTFLLTMKSQPGQLH